jgi:tetratricopeptide (TPR) repeat protein
MGGLLWWQERVLSQAAEALKQGETEYAMYLVGKFLARNPTNSRAMAIQARGLVALGYPEETIKIFDNIGAASADDMHAFARAYMLRGEWSTAQRLLPRVLQLTPDDADVLYELASCQIRLGMYEQALENARKFAVKSGLAARGQVMLGSIYGDMQNDREAETAFASVLVDEPNAENLQITPAEFFLRYGRVLLVVGKPEEALEPLKRSVATEPTSDAFALLGDAALQLGRPTDAELAWKQAVAMDADNLPARTALANAAMLAGDGKQAIEWLKPIAEGERLPSRTTYMLQRAYALLGDTAAATVWQEKTAERRLEEQHIATLEDAMVSQPQSFWARAVRAHQFAMEGNWRQADLIVDGLVKEAPGDPFVIELTDGIRRRSTDLPSLTRIPVTNF